MTAVDAGTPTPTSPGLTTAQLDSHVGLRDVFWLIGRAFAYVKPFGWRYFGKWWFNAIGLIPVLYIPWPGRIITDHVIQDQPVTAQDLAHYPPYLQWAIRPLMGMDAPQIAFWVMVVGFFTLLTFGLFGQGQGSQNLIGGRDQTAEATTGTRTNMYDGVDTAANSENQANAAMSWASGLYGLFEFRFQMRLSQAVNHYYRSHLFERIKALPMTSIEDRRIGDMIYRVMYDTPMITNLLYDILLTPFALGTLGMTIYVMMFSFGEAPEVIWLSLGSLPVIFILTAPFSAFVRRRSAASRMAGAVTTQTIEENMSNIFAVQSLGGWRREIERFRQASLESFRRYRGVVFATLLVTGATLLGTLLMRDVFTFVVGGKIIRGQYSAGDFLVMSFNYIYMAGSMSVLAGLWIRIQDNIVGVRRVFALMDILSESDEGVRKLSGVKEGVRTEGASLVYPDGRRALDKVDFEAKVGEITAIVGATGAGKTSLAYLIPRFHRPTEGRVLIDGQDLSQVSLQSLRDHVTYVFQDTQLFSDSIAENIRYGHPDASMERVIEAAKTAGAHDFITALPEGYETQLGARGAKLSVGQRQRIAIARGLITEAPVLILDEPTSALDPETETYLIDALHKAAEGKAVIIIAHRLSTIAHADKVVFLEAGRVIEQGRPSDLITQESSAYRKFVRLQSQ